MATDAEARFTAENSPHKEREREGERELVELERRLLANLENLSHHETRQISFTYQSPRSLF